MAKYTITHTCGHTSEEQLFGPMSNREKTIEYKSKQLCSDCENTRISEKSKSLGLPQLEGSDKQINWANALRLGLIGMGLPAEVYNYTNSAKFYIDNRDVITETHVKQLNQLLSLPTENHPRFTSDQIIAFKEKYGTPAGLVDIATLGVKAITKDFFNL